LSGVKEEYERACCTPGYNELTALLAKAAFSAELLAGGSLGLAEMLTVFLWDQKDYPLG